MSDRESSAAGREARRAAPFRPPAPGEAQRQDLMVRYLHAVAANAARQASGPGGVPPAEREPAKDRSAQPWPCVRDVMSTPAVSVRAGTPFLDVARCLAREDVGAVPVVDEAGRVLGVVAESDLLAKAASLAAPRRPGALERLLHPRRHGPEDGTTAASLMTRPAVVVHPVTPVADAAVAAARSRIRQLPVTDFEGRLVGVVSRKALLRSLVREDPGKDAEDRKDGEAQD